MATAQNQICKNVDMQEAMQRAILEDFNQKPAVRLELETLCKWYGISSGVAEFIKKHPQMSTFDGIPVTASLLKPVAKIYVGESDYAKKSFLKIYVARNPSCLNEILGPEILDPINEDAPSYISYHFAKNYFNEVKRKMALNNK